MATFSDSFNRANNDTVGNGWSEKELSPGNVRIDSATLNFPDSSAAAVAYRSRTSGFGRNNTTLLFEYKKDSDNTEFDGISVSHDGSTRTATVGVSLNFDAGNNTVYVYDGATSKGNASFTFAAATWYYFKWDILSDNSMKVYINTTGTFTESDLVLSISAFTPSSSDGGRWGIGNRRTGRFRNLTIYDTVQLLSAGNIKKINGIAWANVKKINNIAVANIKKVNGITA